MAEIDKSLEKFADYLKRFEDYKKSDLSETDTRSKIIDSFFLDILGWDETDVVREESVESGFYDYKFSTSEFSFIVEAKRQSADFILPNRGRVFSLETLWKGNSDVIKQIRNYIIDKSLSFGVITNGHQFIFGQFINTSGADWKKNKVVVFKSLEDISENFIEFYNYLSRENVVTNRQIKINLPVPEAQIVLDYLKNSDSQIYRNDFSSQITTVILKAFGEIGRNKDQAELELLKSCYIKNKDIDKYTSELDSAMTDPSPSFDAKIEKIKVSESLYDKVKDRLLTPNEVQTPSPLMIIIGGKGAGKSTFIKYFFEIEVSEKVKSQRPYVYLDFRGYTEQGIKDTKGICQKYIDKLNDTFPDLKLVEWNVLKQIYNKKINNNMKGIWQNVSHDEVRLNEKISHFFQEELKDSSNHLEMISLYLREHCQKNLCLVFDNVDQLGDEAQREAFLLAESMHQRLNCITIISLREGYYNRWKNKPPFDAFHSTVFHISAPPYAEVIKKRIEYITEKINFQTVTGEFVGKSIKLTPDGFKNLFYSLQHTLFGVKNSNILEYLEETSFPDIRLGLDKIKRFLVSGHTNIASYMLSSTYRIPIWEFTKAIAFDNSRYYHSSESMIFNLFRPASNSSSNHFTKIRILEFLLHEGGDKINHDKFFAVKEIVDIFKVGGYSEGIVIEELSQLLNWQMIDDQIISSDIITIGEISILSKVRLNYCGKYYLTHMLQRLHYLELIMQDTPIYSEQYFKKIIDNFPESDQYGKRSLSKTLEAVGYFLEYLAEKEAFDHERTLDDGVNRCLTVNIFNKRIHTPLLEHDMKHLRAAFKREPYKK